MRKWQNSINFRSTQEASFRQVDSSSAWVVLRRKCVLLAGSLFLTIQLLEKLARHYCILLRCLTLILRSSYRFLSMWISMILKSSWWLAIYQAYSVKFLFVTIRVNSLVTNFSITRIRLPKIRTMLIAVHIHSYGVFTTQTYMNVKNKMCMFACYTWNTSGFSLTLHHSLQIESFSECIISCEV
jgi:hypothetical protein